MSTAEPQNFGAVKVTLDGKEIATVPLIREKTFIGRMDQNHIVLDSPAVSRSHAVLTVSMGRYFIVDQGSQNGTMLNGRVVLQDEVKPGDLIGVGPFLLKIVRTLEKAEKSSTGMKDSSDGETTFTGD